MSTYRFRLIFTVAPQLMFWTFMGTCLLNDNAFRAYYTPSYLPKIVLTVHTLHFLAIVFLRWLYETPLETVQHVARLADGPWAQRQRTNPDGSAKQQQREPLSIEFSPRDYCFYTQAGTFLWLALGNWTFWLWSFMPEYKGVTIPLGLAGAILVWRYRANFLGPGFQFVCDVEAEDEAAGYYGEMFLPSRPVV